jgi:hypothetical protein
VEPYFVKFDGIWEVKNANGHESSSRRNTSRAAREIA